MFNFSLSLPVALITNWYQRDDVPYVKSELVVNEESTMSSAGFPSLTTFDNTKNSTNHLSGSNVPGPNRVWVLGVYIVMPRLLLPLYGIIYVTSYTTLLPKPNLPELDSGSFRYTRSRNQTPTRHALLDHRKRGSILVHGQVTIIFVVSVCLSVCLCSFCQPSLIRFRSNLDIRYMSGSSCVP